MSHYREKKPSPAVETSNIASVFSFLLGIVLLA